MDGPIFESSWVSASRAVGALFVAFTASLLDMQYLHVVGIELTSELLLQTVIHTVGIYLSLTVASYFD